MFKTIQLILMAVLCFFFRADAQTIPKLSGRIITGIDGKPLPGASIKIKATNYSTQTDYNGQFSINTPSTTGILIISYTGFITEEVNFNTSNSVLVNAELKEKQGDLEEVVVIGYGQTTKRLSTGSISTVTAKEIENQPVTNVLSALSGRMPGVFVQTTNGLPGGNINIQIRGKGSLLAGTNPLYIVDGVPYDGNPPVAANQPLPGNSIVGTVSPLNNLNPADIESITVLKDADATSIYGSRGSNGVVLITTKKAKAGATRLDLNVLQGASRIAEKPRLLNLNEYLELRRLGFSNDNLVPSADPLSPNYAPDLTVWSQTDDQDWPGYIFGNTARSTDLQGKVSGGKNNTTFSVSGNYHYENTILPGSNSYQRGGLYSQLQHRSENNKWNISVSNQLTQQLNRLSNVINGVSASFLIPPNSPAYLPDGSFNWYSGSNIEAEKHAKSITKTDNSITNLAVSYAILPTLSFKISTGYTKSVYDQTLIFPTIALPPGRINYSQFGDNATQSLIVEPQLNYSLKLKESSISFLLGGTYQNRLAHGRYINASNFKLESLMEDLASAGTIDARTSKQANYRYASAFGRVTYNLMESYILNATIRRDGSSKFGPGNRYGNFGSIGAAWIFSNLTFLKENLPFISYGKFRASYGTTGNDQIADYGYQSTYSSPGTSIYQDVASIRPSRISNENFHWETTRKLDLALEFGLLKDRIFLSADYYLNQSRDQLVQYTIPEITGFTGYQANLPAVIENKGWEFLITAKLIDKKAFNWSTTFNLTLPKNALKSFENFETSTYKETYQLGYDVTRIIGYQFLGIDQTSGKAQYAAQSGEASGNPYFNYTLGKQTPDYYGGFGNNFTYKQFELSIFAQFVKQISKGSLPAVPGVKINNFKYVKDNWSLTNQDSNIPQATSLSTDYYITNSSLNVFNTSFIRLKNLSLSYTVPHRLINRMKIGNFKVYVEGQNLLTFWNKDAPILDPETAGRSSVLSRNFPALKTLVFGLQFTL